MTGRWPWGSGSAPALNCSACGRRMGRNATHFVLAPPQRLVCGRCLNSRERHAEQHPDCPHRWHDLHEHALERHEPSSLLFCTRAAAWLVLDNPEKRTCA